MAVLIDDRELAIDELGLETVGQVLQHVKRGNRLVVNVLIDGEEPDLDLINIVRQKSLRNHTVFIETAEPRQMALEVLNAVESQFDEADRLKGEAVDLLQKGEPTRALERLGGCFTTWLHAQESVLKTAQLLRVDLDALQIGAESLSEWVATFAEQLRGIKGSLEARDFVLLSDILTYETADTTEKWKASLGAIRATIAR
jgi:hypothetical protein